MTLYDQYNNAATTASVSQDFETANDAFDAQLADDFVVPSGQTWTVNEVDVQGLYFNGPGPAASFNVFFYQNSGTLPATPVYTATGLGIHGQYRLRDPPDHPCYPIGWWRYHLLGERAGPHGLYPKRRVWVARSHTAVQQWSCLPQPGWRLCVRRRQRLAAQDYLYTHSSWT